MKSLYLTKYPKNGASSRLRAYQFFSFLEKNGVEIEVDPFFNEQYFNEFYDKNKTPSRLNIAWCYLRRLIILPKVFFNDKVIIEKELFPYVPAWFEYMISKMGVKYIVDYDDAVFHNYDLHPNRMVRWLLSDLIDNVMKYSACVIAGNTYLAERAYKAGAQNVVQIPTVIDMNRYYSKNHIQPNNKVVIGWIGTPSTIKYVKSIIEPLRYIVENHPVEIHVVGANEVLGLGDKVRYIPWTEDTEVDSIRTMDIGLMPLDDSPWEKGKCAYKLIQYMGCGLPVVASAIGMNKEVVLENKTGFLVRNHQEWIYALETLILNPLLRKKYGEEGRLRVIQHYSLQGINDKYVKTILSRS